VDKLVAGVICGALAGVWFDVVALVVFFRMARRPGSWAARVAQDKSPVVFISPLMLFHSLWAMAGLVLGLVYGAVAGGGSQGVGGVFSIVMAAVAAAGAVAVLLKARAHASWLLSFLTVFFLLFGLLLPAWAG
jgi:hypothetical protein